MFHNSELCVCVCVCVCVCRRVCVVVCVSSCVGGKYKQNKEKEEKKQKKGKNQSVRHGEMSSYNNKELESTYGCGFVSISIGYRYQ